MQSKLDRPDGTQNSQAESRNLGALLAIETLGMDAAYRMMAEEWRREREALEWAEAAVGDAADAVLEVAGQPEREFQSFTILTQRRQERQENLPSFAIFAPLREPES